MSKKKPPRRVATIDCETDPFKFRRVPKPFLWVIFDGERYYDFTAVSDAIHFLKDKRWVVYAHNGGKFDYHMPGFLAEMEAGSKLMIINGRIARFEIGECEFRDSCNILPIALKDYAKDKIDYENFEKGKREKFMPQILEYCKADCRYLWELVTAFRDKYGDGLTLAGSAMKVWEHQFHQDIPQSSAGFYGRLSQFYYGGRVECFRTGIIEEPFNLFDINSAYPYAMMHEHPISTEFSVVDCGTGAEIIPQSFYVVDGKPLGCFPSRAKNGLEFKKGEMGRYFVTGWELLAARETDSLKNWNIYARYDFAETTNFRRYVEHFYEIKKNSEKQSPDYLMSKLLMNGLYGKYGADPDNYANYEIEDKRFIDAARQEGKEFAGELGPWAVLKSELLEEQKRYYNVATAASITGFVRAYLWRHIKAIEKEGGRVLYCDTDSIACTGKAPKSMKIGKDLGEWGNDGNFEFGAIAGKKLYAFKKKDGTWKTGCKGVRISPEEIVRVAKGEDVTYQREAPSFGIRKGKIEGPRFVTRIVRKTGK